MGYNMKKLGKVISKSVEVLNNVAEAIIVEVDSYNPNEIKKYHRAKAKRNAIIEDASARTGLKKIYFESMTDEQLQKELDSLKVYIGIVKL